ncbi:lipopolysaccharide heptosyltransferase I [Pseudohalioglobus sediminis]|uniref:Lipopolysaccharide heptosyltransferase 1 n=1 Tax=Pseudohalioglobus sediminis TaxID=2606449 RepID=A0A5B0WU54_9GAMM|nr:lipopolysaccharide heptosyltransferase I [Pseudohalioglobus sediminis]KAA1190614.1 lipopolysaccharide heptosyltransferase I [Pseudohalioglobus sediminis]
MRVLLIKMSSLGDVVHTLPALTDAARAIPGIRFDWVVEEAFAEIPGWHTAVQRTLPIALRRWRKHPFRDFTGPEWREFRRQVRAQHYDAVIDAQGLLKSALVSRLIKAPIYGLDKQSAREPLAARAYHYRIAVPRDMHAVERTRMLFAKALNYPVPTAQGDYGVRENLTHGKTKSTRGLLFFHGTARDEKLWPEPHWVQLAKLAEADGYAVWLPWGSEAERARAERIAGQSSGTAVLPRLDLLGLSGLLLEASGAVAVDTGLGHLAAALDVPTVSLYGPTSTRLIGAYGHNQVHIQSPVGAADTNDPVAMMDAIQPEQVWTALQPMLPQAD